MVVTDFVKLRGKMGKKARGKDTFNVPISNILLIVFCSFFKRYTIKDFIQKNNNNKVLTHTKVIPLNLHFYPTKIVQWCDSALCLHRLIFFVFCCGWDVSGHQPLGSCLLPPANNSTRSGLYKKVVTKLHCLYLALLFLVCVVVVKRAAGLCVCLTKGRTDTQTHRREAKQWTGCSVRFSWIHIKSANTAPSCRVVQRCGCVFLCFRA